MDEITFTCFLNRPGENCFNLSPPLFAQCAYFICFTDPTSSKQRGNFFTKVTAKF